MSFYTLAVSSSSHDSCVCLLEDDKVVVAFPCERTSRQKYTQNITKRDMQIVASYTKQVDLVVAVNINDFNPDQYRVNPKSPSHPNRIPRIVIFDESMPIDQLRALIAEAGITYKEFAVDNTRHHLYHASAAFYSSGFDEANCIVMDGIGTAWIWPKVLLAETTTFFQASQKEIKPIYKNLLYKIHGTGMTGWTDLDINRATKTYDCPVTVSHHLDVGKLYGTITRQIGFRSSTDAGKTMGLAAYGKPNDLPPLLIPGTIYADANIVRNDSQVSSALCPRLSNPSDEDKKNLAYNVQRAAEHIFLKRVEQVLSINRSNNLVLGGGCSLNILANSLIKRTFPHLNIFIEPIATDASQALGAALYHYKRKFTEARFKNLNTLYLGPEYSIVDTKAKLLKLVEKYNNESSLPVNSNPQ